MALCFAIPKIGIAQTIPSTADPGVILQEMKDEPRPPSSLDGALTVGEDKVEAASAEKIFTLRDVILDGSSVYDARDVRAMTKDFLGKPVSMADLNAIARIITRQYREDGYMFSRAIVPPQDIENGVVHFRAIEGRLTDVQVIGDFKDSNNLVRDMAAKLESEGPTNMKALERYLLLIDDLPGIKARSILQPSETPGGGRLIVTVEEDPFEGSIGLDNRGSKLLGRTRATVVGAFNSLLGRHDRTVLRGIVTKDTRELRYFDVSHEEQIGTEGFRIKGRVSTTKTQPGSSLRANDVEGDGRLYDLEGLYPLIRGRQYNLNLVGGFAALDSESDVLGIQVAKDRVRTARIGSRFDFTDSWAGVNQIDLLFTKGLSWLNATEDGLGRSRANGEHDFLRSNVSMVRIQDLPGNFSLQLGAEGQYSGDPLLASEEFTVGGPEFGRAYDTGEISGDRGAAASIELRYGAPLSNQFIKSYQAYSFYDVGKVWNEDPTVAEASEDSAASAGIGVRFNLDYDVSGYVELDKPLTKNVAAEGDDGPRLFFNVLKRF